MDRREYLIGTRNGIVMRYDDKKEHLRELREEGVTLTKEQWEEWDAIDAEMNKELAPIDHELFISGWMY